MEEKAAAIMAARLAGKFLLQRFGRKLTVRHKGRIDLVTDADVSAERKIVSALRKNFPEHGFLLEEGEGEMERDGFIWVIDPIDGTTNFSHAYPFFCISIALCKGGLPLLGVVYDPLRRELFSAEKGKGAFLNGKRIRVSRAKKLVDSLLGADFPYDLGAKMKKTGMQYSSLLEKCQGMRTSGAAALELCHVACGRIDAFFHHDLKPYDFAAAMLIVTEAGGRFTDFRGKPCTIFSREVVASNLLLHGELLSELRNAGRGRGK